MLGGWLLKDIKTLSWKTQSVQSLKSCCENSEDNAEIRADSRGLVFVVSEESLSPLKTIWGPIHIWIKNLWFWSAGAEELAFINKRSEPQKWNLGFVGTIHTGQLGLKNRLWLRKEQLLFVAPPRQSAISRWSLISLSQTIRCQKFIEVGDEHRFHIFYKHMATEVNCGRNQWWEQQAFPMKQGVLNHRRGHLLLSKEGAFLLTEQELKRGSANLFWDALWTSIWTFSTVKKRGVKEEARERKGMYVCVPGLTDTTDLNGWHILLYLRVGAKRAHGIWKLFNLFKDGVYQYDVR